MILCVSCYSYLGQMQEEVQWESVKQQCRPPPPPLHSDSGSNGHFTIYTVTLFLPGLRENYEVDTFLVWLHHGHSMTLSKDAVL